MKKIWVVVAFQHLQKICFFGDQSTWKKVLTPNLNNAQAIQKYKQIQTTVHTYIHIWVCTLNIHTNTLIYTYGCDK